MKKIFIFLSVLSFSIGCIYAQNLQHQTEEKTASVVYFTKDVSPQGLMKVYNALNQKIEGNVGIKVSFGGSHEQVLDANLLSELVKKTNGTMFDANGLSGNRWTAEMNLKLAEQNGFGKIGKMQIVSEENYINLPVKNPYVLKYARTGKEFSEYDTLIAVHRVKLHSLPALGGNIKNVSLCLGNRSGKCIIHSGGKDEAHYHNTEPETLMKSFSDATNAALNYKKNWAFIDVLDDINPECSCKNTKNLGKIGIIASSDIVAVEQCAVDFLIGNADVDSATKSAWEPAHQIKVLEYAEKQGNGNRKYQFVNLDQTSDTLLMSAGNKTFEIKLKDNTVAREFSKFAAGKEVKMQKYGGFEFYVYERLSTGTERKTSKYEKGNIYYNTKFNAISLAYEDHDLGSDQAILIGSFVDKSVCEALKGMKNGITFSFRK
ncbi:MAG: DUF362 domain-containing protein [Treponema sp.]|nr:DUF362 domain-containing protein [Treponema sp.]